MRLAHERLVRNANEKGATGQFQVDVLMRRIEDGYSNKEIGRMLGRKPKNIHYHFSEAKESFRRALREVVRELEPARSVDEMCEWILEILQ